MLDSDLALLYGIETRVLKFELTPEEYNRLSVHTRIPIGFKK